MANGFLLHDWHDRLNDAMLDARTIRRVRVLAETASTQDSARRLGLVSGEVIVAGRQTAGRGRLGRRWADTGLEGVAMTIVLRDPLPRLAVATAIGVAAGVEALLDTDAVGIKWPNDIVARGRKLAGILIERVGDLALVGVGVNVNQLHWPPPLESTAMSLREVRRDTGRGDAPLDRVDVAALLLRSIDERLHDCDERLVEEFVARDVLIGRPVVVRVATGATWRQLRGILRRLDPMAGMELEITPGADPVWLPAETTTVVSQGSGISHQPSGMNRAGDQSPGTGASASPDG